MDSLDLEIRKIFTDYIKIYECAEEIKRIILNYNKFDTMMKELKTKILTCRKTIKQEDRKSFIETVAKTLIDTIKQRAHNIVISEIAKYQQQHKDDEFKEMDAALDDQGNGEYMGVKITDGQEKPLN